jgi:hypothetical protein
MAAHVLDRAGRLPGKAARAIIAGQASHVARLVDDLHSYVLNDQVHYLRRRLLAHPFVPM